MGACQRDDAGRVVAARKLVSDKSAAKYQGDLEKSGTPYEIKDYITDLVGLRLVCLYEDEIEPMGRLVREHFDVIDVTDKTAEIEGTENAFGYKGLHLDLRLDAARAAMPEYQLFAPFPFELQIRTVVQDSWSTTFDAWRTDNQQG